MDVLVTYQDGRQELFYIPLRIMYGSKANPNAAIKQTSLPDWAWAYPTYEFTINNPKNTIKSIVLDSSGLLADVNRENNTYGAN